MFFSTIALISILLLASVSDIRHRTIPNYLSYGGLFLALLITLYSEWTVACTEHFDSRNNVGSVAEQVNEGTSSIEALERPGVPVCQSALGCLSLTIPLLLLHACGGIGGGDVKLGACIGAFSGVNQGISIIFLGHIFAGTFAMVYLLYKQSDANSSHGNLASRGIPMALFYLLATTVISFGTSQ